MAAGTTYCVTQGPQFDAGDQSGGTLVQWFAGGRNLGLCRVNFGVSVNGTVLNPPPLAFTADDGSLYTTVYGGFHETNISSWVSDPVNVVRYVLATQNGGSPPENLRSQDDIVTYYVFNILIKEC